jgi:hypothetical protein
MLKLLLPLPSRLEQQIKIFLSAARSLFQIFSGKKINFIGLFEITKNGLPLHPHNEWGLI